MSRIVGVAALLSVVALCLAQTGGGSGAAGATGAPKFHVSGEVIVKEIKPIERYVHVETKTTLPTVGETMRTQFDPFVEKAAKAGTQWSGAPIFVYRGVDGTPDKQFDLLLGLPMNEGGRAPEGSQTVTLPTFRCASVYYTGPVSGIPQGWQALMEKASAMNLRFTDEGRELYLYWEGDDSPNNVVELQIGVLE